MCDQKERKSRMDRIQDQLDRMEALLLSIQREVIKPVFSGRQRGMEDPTTGNVPTLDSLNRRVTALEKELK